jgi:diguanylate cyclase (GGDEF)-like protein/PAS domain S-box-containing protein
MTDRADLFEAAIDSLPEGLALLHGDSNGPREVVFWNQAAVAITGHAGVELVGRAVPDTLEALRGEASILDEPRADAATHSERGFLARIRHKMGHEVSVIVRTLVLRDCLGQRIGTGILFHPAEHLDALPRDSDEDESVESSQADLEVRLHDLIDDHMRGGPPFGILWVSVDQAHHLRKTHGAGACETMLIKVEKILAQGLRPAEFLGRWGQDEFLVIAHEQTSARLAAHAQKLAGLARTTDFRWWGDRISITVSIGAAQAETTVTLPDLLAKAQSAMTLSSLNGGNQITPAPGGAACSQS